MEIVLQKNKKIKLYAQDIYFEKNPAEIEYTQKHCIDGNIVFKPFCSYIVPIFEYCKIDPSLISKKTYSLKNMQDSCMVIYKYEDDNKINWYVEYMNTTEKMWTFHIGKPIIMFDIIDIFENFFEEYF